jgi:hypothetical protein
MMAPAAWPLVALLDVVRGGQGWSGWAATPDQREPSVYAGSRGGQGGQGIFERKVFQRRFFAGLGVRAPSLTLYKTFLK